VFLITIVILLLIWQGLIIYQNQQNTQDVITIIDQEEQIGYTSGSIVNNNNFPLYTHQLIDNNTTSKDIYLKSTTINLNDFTQQATIKGKVTESTRKSITIDVQKIQIDDVLFDWNEYIFLTKELAINIWLIQWSSLISYSTWILVSFNNTPIIGVETQDCNTINTENNICLIAQNQRSWYEQRIENSYGYEFIKRNNLWYLEHKEKIHQISFTQEEEIELLDILQPLNVWFIIEKYEEDMEVMCDEIISVQESSIQITWAVIKYREQWLSTLYEESSCNININIFLDTTKKVDLPKEESTDNE
jgi:hypothetical protein